MNFILNKFVILSYFIHCFYFCLIRTVVKVKIERSLGLHTTILRRGKEHNSAMVSVGAINVDIPQHPVVLHGMVTRSSREISSTLLEFRRPMSRVGYVFIA